MRAVEDAVGVTIPKNARIIRNLLHGAQFQQDHITHFYQLHALDFVDVVDALKADPKKTAALSNNVSNDPHGGTAYFKEVQKKICRLDLPIKSPGSVLLFPTAAD